MHGAWADPTAGPKPCASPRSYHLQCLGQCFVCGVEEREQDQNTAVLRQADLFSSWAAVQCSHYPEFAFSSLFFPLEVSTCVEKAVRGIPCKARASRGCSSRPTSLLTGGDEGLRASPQGGRVSPGGERVGHDTVCDKRHAKGSRPSPGLGTAAAFIY